MYLLVSTLMEDGDSVLDLDVKKIFVPGNLTNLSPDEILENEGYKLFKSFESYIFSLKFPPDKRDEAFEDNLLLKFSLIPLDIEIIKEFLEIAFSNNPNIVKTKENVHEFLCKLFPDLMEELESLIQDSQDCNVSFKCSLVENEIAESDSCVIVGGFFVDYGGRGPDNDFSLLTPIVIEHSPLTDMLIDTINNEDELDPYSLEDDYGEVEELKEIFEDAQLYDCLHLETFENI